ncbi:hypothetical protein FGO68_gene9957 [Halteria grandinella]|uniref:Uncharacterized protein n=1 Tax=Halteria grandinella TaxID=5974 RepID=A0A8J8T0Y9_HALGN|nr:hypothetical protein FGO68_gene9957 [Halteria grandinella]
MSQYSKEMTQGGHFETLNTINHEDEDDSTNLHDVKLESEGEQLTQQEEEMQSFNKQGQEYFRNFIMQQLNARH